MVLHQATGSKDLVRLFHKAGHNLNYQQVLRVDTALAENTLKSINYATATVIPTNFVEDKFVHFTADNIDILDETLNGKNTFHATQVEAWQQGQTSDRVLATLSTSSSCKLDIPEILEKLSPVDIKEGTSHLEFALPVNPTLFKSFGDESTKAANATDLAVLLARQELDDKPGWTVFNQKHSSTNPEVTSVGYMPIILAPAHELNTLNTVVTQCMAISAHFNQEYTVITVGQALHPKLMELK